MSCGSPYELTQLALGEHTLTAAAIDVAGNVDETPANHTWTVVAPLPPNTPTGTNVEVDLTLPGGAGTATLTFATVTAAGYTTVEALATPPALPAGYLTDGATYYDISTTAVFGEPVTLCIPYSGIADGARLLHHDGSDWVDVTLSDAGGVLCAEIGGLSPFAIVDSTPAAVPTTTIQTAPPASHVSPTATFAFVSEPLSTELEPVEFECALDTLPNELPDWSSCEPIAIFEGLLFG